MVLFSKETGRLTVSAMVSSDEPSKQGYLTRKVISDRDQWSLMSCDLEPVFLQAKLFAQCETTYITLKSYLPSNYKTCR